MDIPTLPRVTPTPLTMVVTRHLSFLNRTKQLIQLSSQKSRGKVLVNSSNFNLILIFTDCSLFFVHTILFNIFEKWRDLNQDYIKKNGVDPARFPRVCQPELTKESPWGCFPFILTMLSEQLKLLKPKLGLNAVWSAYFYSNTSQLRICIVTTSKKELKLSIISL